MFGFRDWFNFELLVVHREQVTLGFRVQALGFVRCVFVCCVCESVVCVCVCTQVSLQVCARVRACLSLSERVCVCVSLSECVCALHTHVRECACVSARARVCAGLQSGGAATRCAVTKLN